MRQLEHLSKMMRFLSNRLFKHALCRMYQNVEVRSMSPKPNLAKISPAQQYQDVGVRSMSPSFSEISQLNGTTMSRSGQLNLSLILNSSTVPGCRRQVNVPRSNFPKISQLDGTRMSKSGQCPRSLTFEKSASSTVPRRRRQVADT